MLCVLTRLTDDLMIVGEENKAVAHQGYPVDCADIEKIAPVFAAIQAIANASNYNGFGVANIKLTPRFLSNDEIYRQLAKIKRVDVNSGKAVATRQSLSLKSAKTGSGENIRFFEVSYIQFIFSRILPLIAAHIATRSIQEVLRRSIVIGVPQLFIDIFKCTKP